MLCLLTYDGQFEERNRIFEFNHSIGLPCTLGEIALTPNDVPAIAHKAASVVEWKYVPGNPTEDAFINAILATDKAGKKFLADKCVNCRGFVVRIFLESTVGIVHYRKRGA